MILLGTYLGTLVLIKTAFPIKDIRRDVIVLLTRMVVRICVDFLIYKLLSQIILSSWETIRGRLYYRCSHNNIIILFKWMSHGNLTNNFINITFVIFNILKFFIFFFTVIITRAAVL